MSGLWLPTAYDRLILSEPTLGRYYPLDESGGSSTNAMDYKSGYWLKVAGSTPSTIVRNQPPLVLTDGRPVTKVNTAAYLTAEGAASGANTTGLATGAATWGLEAWIGGTTDTANFLIWVAFGTASAQAGAFIAKDFSGNACVTSWNGTVLDGPLITDGKAHYVAGWYDGTNLHLACDGNLYGPSAVTFNITALSFAIGAQENNGSYADAFTGTIAKVGYYTSFSAALAMRHYLAGIHSGVLELVTPDVHTWPILAVNTTSGIVSGSANLIANAALAETTALVIEPTAPVAATAALSESAALVIEPTAPVQANATLAETAALIIEPSAPVEQANAALADSPNIIIAAAGLTLAANATLAETAVLVIEQTAATEQANAALAEPVGQVVDPSIPVQANALLNATGGLAGQGGGSLVANAVLSLAGAVVLTAAAAVQANAALSETEALVIAATLAAVQANALLVVNVSTGPYAAITRDALALLMLATASDALAASMTATTNDVQWLYAALASDAPR